MKKIIPLLVLLAFILLRWIFNEPVDYLSDNKVITVSGDDIEMNEAMENARKSLPHFFERLVNPREGDDLFALKVKISDVNGDEYFWLNQLEILDSTYTGIIDNTPNIVACVKEGERYEFSHEDIKDWTYYENGKMKGNATLYVLLNRISKEEADLIRQQIGI